MIRRLFLTTLALPWLAAFVQPLHAQTTWALQAGAGDGSILITVDQFGYYSKYDYDPLGPLPTTGTLMVGDHNELYLRMGPPVGPRTRVKTAAVGASPLTGVPLSSCTGTFMVGMLAWKLDQSVAPAYLPATMIQDGMILTQTHTITNTNVANADFDLAHFIHPHIGGTDHGGGRKPGPPESLFLYDIAKDPSSIGMEVAMSGGVAPVTDRFEMATFGSVSALSGAPFNNLIEDDANSDGLIDTKIHATFAQRRVFSVAPGASVVLTITTIFAGATYVSTPPVVIPPVVIPPVIVPKKPPATSLPDGTYAGSLGPTVAFSSGEGTFGNGGRAFTRGFGWSRSPVLAVPTAAGPNSMRVHNIAYILDNGTGDGSSRTGVALTIGIGLVLAAGLILASKKITSVG